MAKLVTNLLIIHQHPRVLLGMKKRRFGAGRWNGYGGKVLDGESIEESLIREVEEEAGVRIQEFEKVGILDFKLEETGEEIEVHLYKGHKFTGELKETEEMTPKWFNIDEIPFTQMWPTDMYWMPLLLKGKKFRGQVVLDRQSSADYSSQVLSKDIFEVESL